jgi:hypothetical protein
LSNAGIIGAPLNSSVEFSLKMNFKRLAILSGVVALCTAPLLSNTSRSVQRNVNQEMENRESGDRNRADRMAASYSVQESSLELDLADLRDPHTLTVRPSAETIQLQGTITLNGKTLKPLSNGVLQLNLSPYLRQGRQTLQVIGRYRPVEASVEIVLEGPSAEIAQTVGGNGIVNQKIAIDVKRSLR